MTVVLAKAAPVRRIRPVTGNDSSSPWVAVVIPANDEATRIGLVLDRFPRDARFEAIVVDDGSTDGTGEEALAHGAAVVVRHEARLGVGSAIRTGFLEASRRSRPYVALISGDDQHEPGELVAALGALLEAQADYLQGSRWLPGGAVVGGRPGRLVGTRIYSAIFGVLAGRRVTDATNGFRLFSRRILDDERINLDQPWLNSYELEPYLLFKAIRHRYRVIEFPCTVRYHSSGSFTHMRGLADWWRLLRPAILLRIGLKQ